MPRHFKNNLTVLSSMAKLISFFSYYQLFFRFLFYPIMSKVMMNKDKILFGEIENYKAWNQPSYVLGNGEK